MKRSVTLAFSLFLAVVPIFLGCAQESYCFKQGTEPDNFKGIKWGADISTVPSMVLQESGTIICRDPNGRWDYAVYTKENEDLTFWGQDADAIQYHFKEGKFYYGWVSMHGDGRWKNLKDIIRNRFGLDRECFIMEIGADDSVCCKGKAIYLSAIEEVGSQIFISLISTKVKEEAQIPHDEPPAIRQKTLSGRTVFKIPKTDGAGYVYFLQQVYSETGNREWTKESYYSEITKDEYDSLAIKKE